MKSLTPMTNCVIAGSGLSPSMSWKIVSNFGTMKTKRKTMMIDREEEHDDRINHRGLDLVLDLLRLFLELREPRARARAHRRVRPPSPC